jgi:hypothetical protein
VAILVDFCFAGLDLQKCTVTHEKEIKTVRSSVQRVKAVALHRGIGIATRVSYARMRRAVIGSIPCK